MGELKHDMITLELSVPYITRPEVGHRCVCRCHDDVIKWKHFSRYWPFVRGIHRSPVDSPNKGQWRRALMFFFGLRLDKRLSKQPIRRWFETASRSWRHCMPSYLNKRTGWWILHRYVVFFLICWIEFLLFRITCHTHSYHFIWMWPTVPHGTQMVDRVSSWQVLQDRHLWYIQRLMLHAMSCFIVDSGWF